MPNFVDHQFSEYLTLKREELHTPDDFALRGEDAGPGKSQDFFLFLLPGSV